MKNFNWNLVLAIVAGLATMMVVVAGVDFISHQIFPPPEGMNLQDKAAMNAYVESAPISALVLLPIGWVLGAFAGSFVGSSICRAKGRLIFFIVAILTLSAGVLNMIMISATPWYFWLIAAFIFPGALLGSRLAVPKALSS